MKMQFHKDGSQPQNGEIFVFGSNLAGIHGGGAALAAKKQYGAINGKAGDYATMTGGYSATMHFQYFDGKKLRTVVAYVGEDGIEPNVAYKLDANHKPIKVSA